MKGPIRVRVPVRVLDAGGWTDTWFAEYGSVCHLAVEPGVEVVARRQREGRSSRPGVVELLVPSLGERYRYPLDAPPRRHELLEAAVRRSVPSGRSVQITIRSPVPPGSGLGTSAAVIVAVTAALRRMDDKDLEPGHLARIAHAIETDDLQLEAGLQDPIAAAFGGANLISIHRYPLPEVRALELAASTWEALHRRIVTVYLGSPHRSSDLHQRVIRKLERGTAQHLLEPLRVAAGRAARSLTRGDLEGYGMAMVQNTSAQAALHEELVGPRGKVAIHVAERCGALGWKVNGAGGGGGSVSIVGPEETTALVSSLAGMRGFTVLPLRPIARGVCVD